MKKIIKFLKLFFLHLQLIISSSKTNQNKKCILKFDDLQNFNHKVRKLDKLIKKLKIKASWGIIGNSLENNDINFINFLKDNTLINYEFFNHGYTHSLNGDYEFYDKSVEEQRNSILLTQKIVKEKTGITLHSFGAPCNHIDNNTCIALSQIPEITTWLYGIKNEFNIALPRIINFEKGVGKTDIFYFINQYNKLNDKTLLAIQAHPYLWNKLSRYEFYLFIKFLKKEGYSFIFPSELTELHL